MMGLLQFRAANRAVVRSWEAAGDFPPAWTTMADLERVTDTCIERLREERTRRAALASPGRRLADGLDAVLRTDAVEYLDRPDVSADDKLREVKSLHFMNVLIGSYRRFADALWGPLRRIHEEQGRPARVLELASGSGEFTLWLAERARARGLPVEVTGSDIVEEYVDNARVVAGRRGLGARFRVVNAFDMSALDEGEYDLAFIAQSVHHFSPGQLAMVIAQSMRVASGGFRAVDGFRGLRTLVGASLVGAVGSLRARRHHMVYDAFISGRKFFAEAELELIGRIAAPGHRSKVRTLVPTHTLLQVE